MFDTKRKEIEAKLKEEGRLPPGQSLTLKFPVLHYGPVPRTDLNTWTLRAYGLVENEMTWSWEQFQNLPTKKIKTDIHCVTRWSKFDTDWEGVPFRYIAEQAGVKPEANFVIAHAEHGFTANTPLDVMMEDDVLLAYKFDGDFLDPEHGFPVRTFVPRLYFWKSAKWVRGLEFVAEDKLGFWEQAGYHNEADPWKEQRYAGRMGF